MSERTFDEYRLSDEIRRALDVLKYSHPTEVQSEVIPKVFENQDLVVKSQTGSGKTAAFGIPICEQIEWQENTGIGFNSYQRTCRAGSISLTLEDLKE